MQVIKINNKNPNKASINKAAEVLMNDGLVIYPTDTAYGLGGNALKAQTIREVYKAKGRDFSKPTHIIVRNIDMIEEIALINENAHKLIEKFLPGPLTIILNKKPTVPDVLTAGLPTIGVRIPDSNATKLLSRMIDFPYTTPSANKSGGITPYSIEDVENELNTSNIDLALDAGKLPKVKPSTIIDLTKNPPKILREGSISKTDIEVALGCKF